MIPVRAGLGVRGESRAGALPPGLLRTRLLWTRLL